MARITRTSILLWLQSALGFQPNDDVPQYTGNSVIPVFDVMPKITNMVISAQHTATGANTVYTTPTNKDFYLTYFSFSYTKNATSDCTETWLKCFVQGQNCILHDFVLPTTTASSDNVIITFPYPIKIDRNTIISTNGSFTAGAITKTATIGGFILE